MPYIREQYLEWPRRLLEDYERVLKEVGEGGVLGGERLVVGCGMGGSGFSLYAVTPLLESRPFIIVRSDRLPAFTDKRDLVVGVSYSGETYETISCMREAVRRNARVAGVAGKGSTLASHLKSNGGAVVEVEKTGFPRSSLATLVGSLAGLLVGSAAEVEVKGAIRVLDSRRALAEAESIASSIYNDGDPYTPIIASCGAGGVIAERWLTELSENAKHLGLLEVYPEAAHNLIAKWTHTRGYYYTIYLDVDSSKLCRLTREYISMSYKELGPVDVVDLTGIYAESRLGAILYGALVGGLMSVRLGELMHRDPETIEGIDKYKRVVGSRLTS